MKRLLTFVFGAATSLFAAAQMPQPPEIAARSYILIDLSSQQVLAERDADAQADPASLTKLMTAYVALKAVRDGEIQPGSPVVMSRSKRSAKRTTSFAGAFHTPRSMSLRA